MLARADRDNVPGKGAVCEGHMVCTAVPGTAPFLRRVVGKHTVGHTDRGSNRGRQDCSAGSERRRVGVKEAVHDLSPSVGDTWRGRLLGALTVALTPFNLTAPPWPALVPEFPVNMQSLMVSCNQINHKSGNAWSTGMPSLHLQQRSTGGTLSHNGGTAD